MNKLASALQAPQLYEIVADRLQGMVLAGEYATGTRLPAERSLSLALGVGRATVREAIAALANRGILETRPNSGTYVLPGALDAIRAAGAPLAADTSPSATLAARLAIEPLIAEFAAAVGKRDREMEALLDQMEAISDWADAGARQQWNELDRQFHQRIAAMSGNPVMIAIAGVVAGAVDEPLWRQLRDAGIHDPARARLYVYEHRLIYEAIASGNLEAARFYVRQHLERVQKDILTYA
jgi:DNA-binding FadR family transcriptional regulator